MIQRIQTVFLALAIVCLGLMFVFPFATFTAGELSCTFDASGAMLGETDLKPLPFNIIIPIIMVLIAATIFLYKKRKQQMLMARLGYMALLALVVLMSITIRDITSQLPEADTAYGIGLFLPIVALLFLFLAHRAIKKDENLVKSLDRLR